MYLLNITLRLEVARGEYREMEGFAHCLHSTVQSKSRTEYRFCITSLKV